MTDEQRADWERHVVTSDEPNCDCGHPLSYHRGKPNLCGYCPPHSHVRCSCSAVTQTGTPRYALTRPS